MRSATWISDSGTTIKFCGANPRDRSAPYYFRRLTDSLGATAETVKTPRQDGQTTSYTSLGNRSIVLEGQLWVLGSLDAPIRQLRDRQRALLAQAFIPNTWGLLIYYTEDGARQIRARPVSKPTITEGDNPGLCNISIDFTTDAAYWSSTELYTEMAGGYTANWRFIWSPVSAPMGTYRPWAYITNNWVEPIYPTIEVYTTSRIVTLTNNTAGKSITINHPIEEGQKLVVEMEEVIVILWEMDKAGVYQEKEDVSHWLGLGSDPWQLIPGINHVIVSNENPNDAPISVISYRLPYAGV